MTPKYHYAEKITPKTIKPKCFYAETIYTEIHYGESHHAENGLCLILLRNVYILLSGMRVLKVLIGF